VTSTAAAAPDANPRTDLFGATVAERPAARSGKAREGAQSAKSGAVVVHAPLAAVGPSEPIRDPFRGLTAEDIESFKALGTEVRFEAEGLGEWWLVPAYSDKDRKEITPEHAATIARVLTVFPGARVVSFERADG
jgi:hypothetical protein